MYELEHKKHTTKWDVFKQVETKFLHNDITKCIPILEEYEKTHGEDIPTKYLLKKCYKEMDNKK